eukprot:TRINITY_DN6819_c0_g1_i3.p1 TRINITY_DN6819_c0_g1~~TRINITY_DN6819_c0_g1_i3.p1  ORF type:complete len:130 (-),score=27.84 TRINITY_DN6819_c0_g1_i3:40-429(-)
MSGGIRDAFVPHEAINKHHTNLAERMQKAVDNENALYEQNKKHLHIRQQCLNWNRRLQALNRDIEELKEDYKKRKVELQRSTNMRHVGQTPDREHTEALWADVQARLQHKLLEAQHLLDNLNQLCISAE